MGRTPRWVISPLLSPWNQAMICCTFLERLAWVSMTPLLTPVVPPVYCRQARLSKFTEILGAVEGYFFRRSIHSYTLGVGGIFRCLSLATMGRSCFLGNFR